MTVARRREGRSRKGTRGTGLGLGLFILAVIAYVMREHWPWLVGVGAVIVAAWVWWLVRKFRLSVDMDRVDAMGGHEFERFLVRLFKKLGYRALNVGAGGGDFGADLIVERRGVRIAVQAKNYDKGRVGNDAVQQAIAGATYYKCARAMVVTNSRFTKAAHEQARGSEAIPVVLWGRAELQAALLGREPD